MRDSSKQATNIFKEEVKCLMTTMNFLMDQTGVKQMNKKIKDDTERIKEGYYEDLINSIKFEGKRQAQEDQLEEGKVISEMDAGMGAPACPACCNVAMLQNYVSSHKI